MGKEITMKTMKKFVARKTGSAQMFGGFPMYQFLPV